MKKGRAYLHDDDPRRSHKESDVGIPRVVDVGRVDGRAGLGSDGKEGSKERKEG